MGMSHLKVTNKHPLNHKFHEQPSDLTAFVKKLIPVLILTYFNYELPKRRTLTPSDSTKNIVLVLDKMISILILNSNTLYYVFRKLIYNYFFACRWLIVSQTM
jgi:hypothetical protein